MATLEPLAAQEFEDLAQGWDRVRPQGCGYDGAPAWSNYAGLDTALNGRVENTGGYEKSAPSDGGDFYHGAAGIGAKM